MCLFLHLRLCNWLLFLRDNSLQLVHIWRWFRNWFRSAYSFLFLYLQIEISIWPPLIFRAKSFVLFVNIEDQLLNMAAGNFVFLIVLRTYANMQRLWRFFLIGSLDEPRPLPSQPQLNMLNLVWCLLICLLLQSFIWRVSLMPTIFAAKLNDPLHVAPFSSD